MWDFFENYKKEIGGWKLQEKANTIYSVSALHICHSNKTVINRRKLS